MAISFTQVNTPARSFVMGDHVRVVTDVTLDNSYATGGYAIAASDLGLSNIETLDVSLSPATGGVLFAYNYATKKLMAFANTGAQTSNATDLSTCTGRLVAVGRTGTSFAP